MTMPNRIEHSREIASLSRERETEGMETQTGRLLVVDDNEMNRDMLSRRLARLGHTVVTAEDGNAALERIAQEPYDLVLLDIMMPGIDGFEVLERLRQTHAPTELPVIMATAKDEREDIVKALKSGANDYVTKPLDFPVVAARVQTQLSLKYAVDRIVALEKDLKRRNEELQSVNERMTKDLAASIHGTINPPEDSYLTTGGFMEALEGKLKSALGA